MRAILIKDGKGPIENLYIGEAPLPLLKSQEVLVKIKAFALNRMDISQREGNYPPPPGASEILGVEFSGHITALGPNASSSQGWKIGEEVLGLASGGAYAEFIAVPETQILRKPPGLSWVEAAGVPEAFITAFQALVLVGDIQRGDDVLIHAAASGVGIAAIQLARFYGARTITATASTKEKLDWLLSLPAGATHAANYKKENFVDVTKRATDGKGVDLIVDMVGQAHFTRNLDALAMDGRMTMLSLISGSEVSSLNLRSILGKRLRIQGSTLRSQSADYKADVVRRFAPLLVSLTGSEGDGLIRTYVHKVYPWTEIKEATRVMEADQNIGKIVIEVV
ncbi:quinone oxidoreductase [Multifurca ochricompacta]|uniref:Quinone oxidoreductase n=1 Tax=Multifurca ochricompacta TaxID=376703 RepID=A0AAD4LWQ8_9AGAM|nr:quinone oxidoreductase [Multifurca ochricompacta]